MRLAPLFLTLILTLPVFAHPGSGIVVDRLGQVYFVDTGSGLWKIDAHGTVTKIATPRFHWLALDADDRFRNVAVPTRSQGEIERAGSRPTLLLASDFPLTVARDGNLYYPLRGNRGSLDIMRLTPDGRSSIDTTLSLPYVNGLAAADDGSLYYTEDAAIRRIAADGKVATVSAHVVVSGCSPIPAADAPLLRGLAVDAKSNVYVAASGCGSVLRVTPAGRITKVLQIEPPWSPTAVALFKGDVYVLEYLHTEVEDRLAWLPRVRKISPDGKAVILATISR